MVRPAIEFNLKGFVDVIGLPMRAERPTSVFKFVCKIGPLYCEVVFLRNSTL